MYQNIFIDRDAADGADDRRAQIAKWRIVAADQFDGARRRRTRRRRQIERLFGRTVNTYRIDKTTWFAYLATRAFSECLEIGVVGRGAAA